MSKYAMIGINPVTKVVDMVAACDTHLQEHWDELGDLIPAIVPIEKARIKAFEPITVEALTAHLGLKAPQSAEHKASILDRCMDLGTESGFSVVSIGSMMGRSNALGGQDYIYEHASPQDVENAVRSLTAPDNPDHLVTEAEPQPVVAKPPGCVAVPECMPSGVYDAIMQLIERTPSLQRVGFTHTLTAVLYETLVKAAAGKSGGGA